MSHKHIKTGTNDSHIHCGVPICSNKTKNKRGN